MQTHIINNQNGIIINSYYIYNVSILKIAKLGHPVLLRKSKKTVIANNQDIEQKDYAGTIIDIDYKKKEVLLKRGTSQGILPKILSIGPNKPTPNTKLISNTYKFIDTLLKNEKKYEALNDFLEKKHPNIKGIKTGEKIIKSNEFNK